MKELIIKLFNKYKQVIMYLIFGVLTTIIALAIYYLLVFTILDPNVSIQLQFANVLSWIGGVTFAYFTNRKYVFESEENNKVKEATKFYLARLITLFLDMLVMFVGVTLFHYNDKIIKIISQISVIVANYIFSKLVVFKKQKKFNKKTDK